MTGPDGDRGSESLAGWDEDDSRAFIELGDLFVPARATQARIVAELIPTSPGAEGFDVLDLATGAGRLAAAILERWPTARVTGVDASEAMLEAARRTNAAHGERFAARRGTLEGLAGGLPGGPYRAVVSSLAVHHLDHDAKRRLFGAVLAALEPGGAFLLVDVTEVVEGRARELAAALWDESVAAAAAELSRPDALTRFRREGWNLYALAEPDPEDRPATVAQHLDWMRQVGFAEVDVVWMLAGHAIFHGVRPASP